MLRGLLFNVRVSGRSKVQLSFSLGNQVQGSIGFRFNAELACWLYPIIVGP